MGAPLVGWLRRPGPRKPGSEGESEPEKMEEASVPGVASLFRECVSLQPHAVLDLGPANSASLAVHGQVARRVRFLDLFSSPDGPRSGLSETLDTLPPDPPHPFDVVFAWNALDRLFPEERPLLVARLAEFATPSALLHIMVEMSDTSTVRAHRFSLLDAERVTYLRRSPTPRYLPPLLPAEVERLLHPFRVLRAFTLKAGFREYVASLQHP